MLYSIIGMLVIIVDQLVKFWVDRNINWTNPTRPVLPGILSLVRVQNDGAAFSFLSGSGARIWFIVLTGVFALLVILALATNFISGKFGRWCLVLVTAGGLSNMIDRIRYGFVIDMFKIELFDFAVFNVADIFISIFCIAFIIYILFGGEKEREEDADEFDEEDYEEEDRPQPMTRKPAKRPIPADDYDEAEVSRRQRPERKAAPKRTHADYEDEEDDYDEPRRRADRAAAAAATAYSSDKTGRSRRTVSAEPSEPEVSAPVHTSRNPELRRTASDRNFEEMFSADQEEAPAKKPATRRQAPPRRPAPSSNAEEPRPQASRPQAPRPQTPRTQPVRPQPVHDPNNPFAEWEQANARVASQNNFNSFVDDAPEKPEEKRPARTPAPVAEPEPPASIESFDSFDLDDILKEFK